MADRWLLPVTFWFIEGVLDCDEEKEDRDRVGEGMNELGPS